MSRRPAASSRAQSSASAPPSPPGSGCRSPSGKTAQARDCSALTTQILETLMSTNSNKCGVDGFLQGRVAGGLLRLSLTEAFVVCYDSAHPKYLETRSVHSDVAQI